KIAQEICRPTNCGKERQAPTSGRLAASIATISLRRRRKRNGAERNNERTRCIRRDSLRADGEPAKARRRRQNGRVGRACRYVSANSNASAVGSADGSTFVAADRPAATEIFSALSRVANYCGLIPKARAKRSL